MSLLSSTEKHVYNVIYLNADGSEHALILTEAKSPEAAEKTARKMFHAATHEEAGRIFRVVQSTTSVTHKIL